MKQLEPLGDDARLLYEALRRESLMLTDNLSITVSGRELRQVHCMLVLDWVQRQVAKELHLVPTVGDLIDRYTPPDESGGDD